MRYKVIGRCLGRNFTFNLIANGRKEAAKKAKERLKEMYKALAFEITHLTRARIEISGKDYEGDDVLTAVVNPFPEPEE